MKTQMKAMQRAVAGKEKEELVREKGPTSVECNLSDVKGYKEYDEHYRDLDGLYANKDTEGFPPDK